MDVQLILLSAAEVQVLSANTSWKIFMGNKLIEDDGEEVGGMSALGKRWDSWQVWQEMASVVPCPSY